MAKEMIEVSMRHEDLFKRLDRLVIDAENVPDSAKAARWHAKHGDTLYLENYLQDCIGSSKVTLKRAKKLLKTVRRQQKD